MERSGRREVISTREKSLSARSRSVGRVRGKSIIVPRIGTSHDSALGWACTRWEWRHPITEACTELGMAPHLLAAHSAAWQAYRLFPVANRVNFREDADDRWSVQSRARGGPATRTARVRLSSLRRRSATRKWGSGQKEWAGEEALYWESSVFRDGRSTPRVVLSDRCNTLGRQSDPRPFYGPIARVRVRRSE